MEQPNSFVMEGVYMKINKLNKRIGAVVFLLLMMIFSFKSKAELVAMHKKYAECFKSADNAQAFSNIVSRARIYHPYQPCQNPRTLERSLKEGDTVKKHFEKLKGLFSENKSFSFLKAYKEIDGSSENGKICQQKVQELIGDMANSLISDYIQKLIIIGSGDMREKILEASKKDGEIDINTNAISNGVIEPLNQELLEEIFALYSAVYDFSQLLYPNRHTSKEEANRYEYFFEDGLIENLFNLNKQINYVYGSNFASRALPQAKYSDYLFDFIGPVRKQILTILLKNEKTAPILGIYLVGEFLKPIGERLINVSKVRDLFFNHRESLKGDAIFDTIKLFSNLDDPEKLSSLVQEATRVEPELINTLEILTKNKDNFYRMIKDINKDHRSKYGKDVIVPFLETASVSVKPYLLPFYETNQLGKKLISNKENEGVGQFHYDGGVRNIRFPFSETNYQEIMKVAKQNNSKLSKALGEVKKEQKDDFHEVKDLMVAKKQSLAIEAEIKREEELLIKKQSEIFAMQKMIADENIRMDQYARKLDSLRITLGGRNIARTTELKDTFNLSPNSNDLTHHYTVKKGDIVQFNVTGNWNPACALKKDGFPESDLLGAKVGPLGVEVSFSRSSFNLNSVNDSLNTSSFYENSSSYSNCVEAYAEARASVGAGTGNLLPGFHANVEVSTGFKQSSKSCRQTLTGNRDSQDHSILASQNERISRDASLSRGLRSSHTPYPNWPVGSLLLFELPKDSSDLSKARRVSIIDRNQITLISEDSEIFILANDCSTIQGTEESLTIDMEVKRSGEGLAHIISKELVKSLAKIWDSSYSMIKEGLVTGFDLSNLRSEVKVDIINMTGYDINELSVYSEFFNSWIESELSQIERKSRLSNLLLDEKMKILRLDALFMERSSIRDLERLIYKNVVFSGFNEVNDKLEREFSNALAFWASYVVPAIEFFHEEIFTEMHVHSDIGYKLNLRMSIPSITESLLEYFDKVVEEGRKKKKIESNGLNRERIIVTIPKIESDVDDGFLEKYYAQEENSYHVIDLALAKTFWEKVEAREGFNFSLPLDKLYYEGNIPGLEKCCAYPVIKSITAAILSESEDISKKIYPTVGVKVKPTMNYVLRDRFSYFNFKSERLLNFSVPLVAGKAENLREEVASSQGFAGNNSGQGLSPLAELEFNFSKLFQDRSGVKLKQNVSSLAIIYEVEYKKVREDLCILKGL